MASREFRVQGEKLDYREREGERERPRERERETEHLERKRGLLID